ncbi:methyltransferase domain-containing protein [Martelella alba]|uniref:Methyltransferase domain-containing protein n=1 Tax=Martelella alba TaxID=2590451 RepID=A0A506UAP7_9HYPH|nr:methyltransferase domain-containing protein [Martelella alba]TPW30980.1 methyltransferase domain-containing protein [Martelella alba]
MNASFLSSGDLIADRRADYARMLDEAGDFPAAADLMLQALELVPDWPAGLALLAAFHEHAGDIAGAIASWTRLDQLDREDIFAARLKLAVLGATSAPRHPPGRYVEALFDSYADRFDEALVERLDYSSPERLARLLNAAIGPERCFSCAVDLGCGTGLSGEVLRERVARLEGFDLSQNMLAKAAEKGLYDHLAQADLLAPPLSSGLFFEEGGEGRADLVIAADVLMYLGALETCFQNVMRLMTPDGLLLFSVEDGGATANFTLQPSLRYAHAHRYITATLADYGFVVLAEERAALRKDGGEPVHGILFLAARTDQTQ